ncbi:pyridoxal kinase [Cavenderia fasciculata]|uniref:pyridoxal kinase n=1 Tax=Cavenderia fasciculata TaxID=261658 RepID=F4PHP3_CACFS|nr:pyridoxal kinase [Cavenderia fasciculata]EGG25227.1 pyridoxal kinase [Cavenderia fasciculata]|eukprot:XP_004363078.1 pyridoxal kinase [Cavenderia fasciculata]
MENSRVLSIQSWVCHGYVGNKCAVLALQHLGVEVDPINTVQLSNNTAYSSWKGETLSSSKLLEIYDALDHNKIADYTHVLTGYNNNAETLRSVLKIVKSLKEKNPSLIYACDPVLGDNGKLYVPEDLVSVYRDEVIPHADYLFPNQTEAELLTGVQIKNESDALIAVDKLHAIGIKNVVITSLFLDETQKNIMMLGSQKGGSRFKIIVPKFEGYYTGTGDLFSSLLLGWSATEPNLAVVCERAVSTLYNILKVTHEAKAIIPNAKNIEYHELRLVQARHFIGSKENSNHERVCLRKNNYISFNLAPPTMVGETCASVKGKDLWASIPSHHYSDQLNSPQIQS